MGIGVFLALIIAALVIGYAIQHLVRPARTYEWIVVAIALVGGAFMGSEMLAGSSLFSGIKDWGPQVDGMLVVPAVLGALVIGVVAEIGLRAEQRTA